MKDLLEYASPLAPFLTTCSKIPDIPEFIGYSDLFSKVRAFSVLEEMADK
jgi:hypothetical protein